MGLIVACPGVAGTTARALAHRTKETGIRLALGAERTAVVRVFVSAGMLPIITGLLVGSVVSLVFANVLRRYLFGIDAWDAVAHLTAAFAVLGMCGAVVLTAARRVLTTDVVQALRVE